MAPASSSAAALRRSRCLGIANDGNLSSYYSYTCTSGFVVYAPWLNGGAGGYYLMTAGHCVNDGSSWYTFQSNRTFRWIGPPVSWFTDGRGDAALILITGPYFCYAFGGSCNGGNAAGYNVEFGFANWQYWLDNPIYQGASSYPGLYVCHVGAGSGGNADCGTDSYAPWIDANIPGIGVGHMTYNTGCGTSGDSGGPWFNGTTGYGIHYGGSPANCPTGGAFYTEVVGDLSNWGLNGGDI